MTPQPSNPSRESAQPRGGIGVLVLPDWRGE
jgi:hypothetical protein